MNDNNKVGLRVPILLVTVWSTILLMLALLSPVHAADLEAGKEAYERGDFPAALREFRPLAEQGLAEAQVNLGFMYAKGQGVPQDDVEAVTWYRKAAEQGHAAAQFSLGYMYANGEGVPQNEVEAVRWYRKAAKQGLAAAQFSLGYMYANGEGVPQNEVEAVRWYRRAAEQGHAAAQFNLGYMYNEGRGVLQDDGEAYAWLNIAVAQGSLLAETREVAVEERDRVAQRMTNEARSRAQQLAREYWEAYVRPFQD